MAFIFGVIATSYLFIAWLITLFISLFGFSLPLWPTFTGVVLATIILRFFFPK
jgi:hypothetical protein